MRFVRSVIFGLFIVSLGVALSQVTTCAADPAAKVDRAAFEREWNARRRERLTLVPVPVAPPTVEPAVSNPIDRFIVAGWSKLPAKERTPALCDDATFARRVYLDIIGTIPPPTELGKFLLDKSPQKREKLIDALLARNVEYAAHWAPFWEDALASQHVTTQGGIPTHGNYRDWIMQAFVQNRPYDLFVAELIDPTMPGRRESIEQEIFGIKYAIGYVRNDTHGDTLQTAANVGQVFFGASMKCASCHDHFENAEWTQERFLGFASLFAPHDLEKIRCEVKTGTRIQGKFPYDLPSAAQSRVAPSTPPLDIGARLHETALQIVDPANPRFATTIVNRLWKRYLGLGLIEPVDDVRDASQTTHPELLAWLAHDFLSHDCDLKQTIRLILTSRTYQLKYDPQLEDQFEITQRDAARYFRSPSLRRLTCEQFLDSVRVATTGQIAAGERTFLDSRSTALMRALGRPATRNEIITARPDERAVMPALELLNGPELAELIDTNLSFGKPLPKTNLPATVDQLYRKVLSRPASNDEKRLGAQFLQGYPTVNDGVRDLYWALLVSPEFQYIH